MHEEELINRIRQGDEAAAEELIHRWYPRIFRYCRTRCGNRETAEDLTQETFLRLFRYLPVIEATGISKRICFPLPIGYVLKKVRTLPYTRWSMKRG